MDDGDARQQTQRCNARDARGRRCECALGHYSDSYAAQSSPHRVGVEWWFGIARPTVTIAAATRAANREAGVRIGCALDGQTYSARSDTLDGNRRILPHTNGGM